MVNKYSNSALLVFSRVPVEGEVKTRLIPALGAKRATSIYRTLLERTLTLAAASRFSNIQLWLDGEAENTEQPGNNKYSMSVHRQKGRDLGERMATALSFALQDHEKAVLIGCDCADLTVSDLNDARQVLSYNADVVIGPSADGGYYLIGMKTFTPELFVDMPWGSADVFALTQKRVQELGLTMTGLQTRHDIDVAADLGVLFRSV